MSDSNGGSNGKADGKEPLNGKGHPGAGEPEPREEGTPPAGEDTASEEEQGAGTEPTEERPAMTDDEILDVLGPASPPPQPPTDDELERVRQLLVNYSGGQIRHDHPELAPALDAVLQHIQPEAPQPTGTTFCREPILVLGGTGSVEVPPGTELEMKE